MSRIILHIGTHKTATTSIQRFLASNRAQLQERGVYYPDYTLIGRTSHYAHLGMVNALSNRHKNYKPEVARKFFTKVRDAAQNFDTTVISAEPFYRHISGEGDDIFTLPPEQYWERRHAYIESVRELFGNAQIVVTYRRQADYAQSLYQEHVKVTRYKKNFTSFLEEFWYHFQFKRQTEAWKAVFPDTRVVLFEKLVASGDVPHAFCNLLGIPSQGLPVPIPANEGMLTDLIIMKRMLHRGQEDKAEIRKKLERLQRHLPEDIQKQLKRRSFFASENDAQAFQSRFSEDNETLRPLLLQNLAAGEPLFPTTFKKPMMYGDKLHYAMLQALLTLADEPSGSPA